MHKSEEPKTRGRLYMKAATAYFGLRRRVAWMKSARELTREKLQSDLPFVYASHRTPMLRRLSGLDMRLQENKVTNLKIAAGCLDGLILRPGMTFSFWYNVGKPSRRRGFLEGMYLQNGKIVPGVGGGLCQMSNLIYWITVHTPLTVTERHRHGYDVFPDAKRTQPFASGATVYYPYVDLTIRNDTSSDYQLRVGIDGDCLTGEWRTSSKPEFRYEVVEKDHSIRSEFWGGYTRHNALWRNVYDTEGNFLREEFITENDALMLYSPLLSDNSSHEEYVR